VCPYSIRTPPDFQENVYLSGVFWFAVKGVCISYGRISRPVKFFLGFCSVSVIYQYGLLGVVKKDPATLFSLVGTQTPFVDDVT
jgi:hypothetical protein